MKQFLLKHRELVIFFFLSFFSAFLFSFQLGKESFWLDEMYSVRYATHFSTFLTAVGNGSSSERNMWLYYVILHWWVTFGTSEVVVRMLSVVFGVGGVVAMYVLGKETFGRKAGIIAAILLMLNTFYLQYAQEARAYSLFVFIFCLSSYAMVRLGKKFSVGNVVIYITLGIAAIFTHIFSIIFLLFQALYLVGTFRKSGKKLAVTVDLFIGFFIVLYLLIHNPGRQVGWIPKPSLVQFALTYIFFCSGFVNTLVYGGLILYSLFGELKMGLKRINLFFWYLVFLALIPVAVVFIYSVTVKPIFIYRYLIFAMPAIILLGAQSLSLLKRNTFILIFGILMIFHINTLYKYFSTPNKEQWREAVATIAQQAHPNDLIIIYPAFLDAPFYYYRERNPSLKKIKTITILEEDQKLKTDTLINDRLKNLESQIPKGGGVWVVSRKENLPAIRAYQKKILDKRIVNIMKEEPQNYPFYQLDIEYFPQE